MKIFAIILLLTLSVSASAEWSISQDKNTNKWYATNGSDSNPNRQKIEAVSKKAANKLAKKLNKAEESVWNDGSEYCANPLNEC